MKILEQFAQEIQGRITLFLMKYFKEKQKPEYWMDEVKKVSSLIKASNNVLELKLSMQEYLQEIGRRVWMAVPGSRTRDYYKSLRGVLNDPEYSDKSLLITMGEEEKVAVDRKVRRIRKELRTTVKMVKRECRKLKKGLEEQTAEVERLSIENKLLIKALVKLNDQYTKMIDEDNTEALQGEISQLKSESDSAELKNQKLIKIISLLIKCSSRQVKEMVNNTDDSAGLIVLKLKQMSEKRNAKEPQRFFSEGSCRSSVASSFDDSVDRSSVECC